MRGRVWPPGVAEGFQVLVGRSLHPGRYLTHEACEL